MIEDFEDAVLTRAVIGGFYAVYNTLGFGFLEQVYVIALEIELQARGIHVEREKRVSVYYRDREIALHRLDLLVEQRLIVECKSTELLAPTAKRQLVNYLKATRHPLGLLLHFGPKPSVARVIHSVARRPGS